MNSAKGTTIRGARNQAAERAAGRSTGRIAATFARLQAARQVGFVPFIMAGDPDLDATLELLRIAADTGADLIELGMPFADPMADGPVLQRSAERALARGATLPGILEVLGRFRRESLVPVILFGYANPFLRYGVERLVRDAAQSGADGILCVDMPPEEADELRIPAEATGLDMIFLLAPTSDLARVDRVAACARGFVYFVSITGTTGAAAPVATEVAARVGTVRARTGLPVGVGFGISTPSQAVEIARIADAVVVGSAIMRLVEDHSGEALLPTVREFLSSMAAAVHAVEVPRHG